MHGEFLRADYQDLRAYRDKIKVKPCPHTGDLNKDGQINLSELLPVIRFCNSNGIQCDPESEDGFAPGQGDTDCVPHSGDYSPQDWRISLGELLRLIQFYNSGGYYLCPDEGTKAAYCTGPFPSVAPPRGQAQGYRRSAGFGEVFKGPATATGGSRSGLRCL